MATEKTKCDWCDSTDIFWNRDGLVTGPDGEVLCQICHEDAWMWEAGDEAGDD